MTEKEKLDYLAGCGINIHTGMRYADDSMEFYEQLMAVLIEEYEDKKERTQKEAEKKSTDYTVLVHGLKNNAKALGAQELAEMAYAHEQAVRSGNWEYIADNLNKLCDQWERTVQIFRKLNN